MHQQKADLYAIDPATLAWRKSSFTANDGQCVELAPLPNGGFAIRDSKNPDGPHLCFTAGEKDAFFKGVDAGEFKDI